MKLGVGKMSLKITLLIIINCIVLLTCLISLVKGGFLSRIIRGEDLTECQIGMKSYFSFYIKKVCTSGLCLFLRFLMSKEEKFSWGEDSSNTFLHSFNIRLVLLIDLIVILNSICLLTCVVDIFLFDPSDDLKVIPFLKIASALGDFFTWLNLVHYIALR